FIAVVELEGEAAGPCRVAVPDRPPSRHCGPASRIRLGGGVVGFGWGVQGAEWQLDIIGIIGIGDLVIESVARVRMVRESLMRPPRKRFEPPLIACDKRSGASETDDERSPDPPGRSRSKRI